MNKASLCCICWSKRKSALSNIWIPHVSKLVLMWGVGYSLWTKGSPKTKNIGLEANSLHPVILISWNAVSPCAHYCNLSSLGAEILAAAASFPYFLSRHTMVLVADRTRRGFKSCRMELDIGVRYECCSEQCLPLTTVLPINETGCTPKINYMFKQRGSAIKCYHNTSHWQWEQI